MNINENSNIEDLRTLIRGCDDENFNHLIWVSKKGDVTVEKFKTNNPSSEFELSVGDNLKFWIGVFYRSNGYVGEQAANDDEYLNDLYKNIIDNWQNDFLGHVEN